MQEKPLLSVVMITYNQEEYIQEAIKGVLLQETDFNFEFIIANDSSSDNTDAIIRKNISQIPDHIDIKYILHEKNIGAMNNFISCLKQATGKYIAICEGDDYWIHPKKLQFQSGFLENNNDFSLIYHRVKYFKNYTETILPHHQNKNEPQVFTLKDISKINFINTPSVVFRNFLVDYDNLRLNSKIGDYPLWLFLAEKGKIQYFPEILAVYREGVGIQSSLSKIKKLENTNEMLFPLLNYFKEKNRKIVENLHFQIKNNTEKIKIYKRYKYKFSTLAYTINEDIIHYKKLFFNEKKD